jgi:hypothetical protein
VFDWLRPRVDQKPATPDVTQQCPSCEALRRDVAALRADVEGIARGWKLIAVEWEEWYDKYRQLYARLAKRESRASKADPDTPASRQDDPGATIDPAPIQRGSAVGLSRLQANRARYGGQH